MFLSWLYLIIGWLIISAYAVVWTRANPGHLMRRGHSPARKPPPWSYLLVFIGTAVAVLERVCQLIRRWITVVARMTPPRKVSACLSYRVAMPRHCLRRRYPRSTVLRLA